MCLAYRNLIGPRHIDLRNTFPGKQPQMELFDHLLLLADDLAVPPEAQSIGSATGREYAHVHCK